MTKRSVMSIVFAGLGALMVATTAPAEAEACGGAWFPEVEVDFRPMAIAMAEKQLDQGKVAQAAATVIRTMPHVGQLNAKRSKIVERGQRVLAVAVARTNGKLELGQEVPAYARAHWAGKTEKDRQANLTFAVNALRKVNEIKKDDPAAQTELAEALARVDAHKSEARDMLEKLAKKDLIATPEGYAVLAELRAKAGDESGKKLALKRCEAMAPGATVCQTTARG
ncbi:MAG: hypothetical protein KF718_07240 [Polyangiaceae bacterium]|nr:hypothetical protein [Polyangiaceae bacterium]